METPGIKANRRYGADSDGGDGEDDDDEDDDGSAALLFKPQDKIRVGFEMY